MIKIGHDALNRPRRKTYWQMVWNGQQWVEQLNGGWVNTLDTSSTVRIYDIAEIRAAINANLGGLESSVAAKKPRLVWSGLQNEDGSPGLGRTFIAGVTTVRATHFNEMLQATRDLRDNQGLNFTHPDGPVVAETRLIKLQDPVDLRGWVEGHEGSSPLAARVYIRYDDYSDSTYNPGNAKGRRTEMWDSSGHTRWTYDSRGRVIVEERWIDGAYYLTRWAYDAMDRVTSMTYPDGEVVNYTYNNQLLLATMTGWSQYITGTNYNALGKPTRIFLGNGRVTDIQYCGVEQPAKLPYGALASMATTKSADPNTLQDAQYTYDNGGNLTQLYDIRNGETINCGYDHLDRLTSAGAPINGSYSFSQIGNLMSPRH